MNLPFFCYGTLRTGEGNYHWSLEGKTFREVPATLTGVKMLDNHGGFPFVTTIDAPADGTVLGDLMYVPADLYDGIQRRLDALEGYRGPGNPHNMYDREIVTVTTIDGEQVEAYAYLTSPRLYHDHVKDLPLIESGDWVAYSRAMSAFARGW